MALRIARARLLHGARLQVIVWTMIASPAVLHAQEADQSAPAATAPDQADTSGEVVVTGSYVAKPVQANASPISLIGSKEIASRGVQSVEGLLSTLPANGMSKRFNDATGSTYTAGTSQLNLRGLGFSSTLTLINGRRQTLAPAPDTDGASFVDINPIPLIMIERLEVLTDGASALYGSDAVAGVANFIMRRKMSGIEVRGSVNGTFQSWQTESNASAAGGFSSGSWDVVAGVQYMHRTRLGQIERDYSAPFAISGFGSPGAFQPVGGTAANRVRDPNCVALGGIASAGNLCSVALAKYFDLIPREDRISGYLTTTYDVGNGLEIYGEGGYSNSKVAMRTSPSYLNAKFPIVPANNPGNLVANGGLGVAAYYFGRPFGSSFPGTTADQELTMYRGVIGARGKIAEDWRFDTSFSYSRQQQEYAGTGDVNAARYAAALRCQGGPSNNLCFNPFGSALLNPALANSPVVVADFARTAWRKSVASLAVWDGVLSGRVGELPGGALSIAIGAQYRKEMLDFRADIEQQTGQLSFLFSGPNFDSSRAFSAGFMEIDIPVRNWVTLNVAGRYEHIGGGFGGTFNPKGSLRIEPTDGLVLRGSVGSSFRAPSLSQITSIANQSSAIVDPLNPSTVPFFTAVRTVPNADLAPEKSLAYNLGVVWRPMPSLSLSVDYYSYDYTGLIVKQDAQSIVNANPLDPRIDRLAGTGPIQSINVSFENAQSVKMRGIDFAADYSTGFLGGKFSVTGRASYTMDYRANVGHGRNEQLAGFRNYQNFAPPVPNWRGNINARFEAGPHQLSITNTYIGPVRENYNNVADPNNNYKIGSFNLVDAQYMVRVDAINSEFQIGIQNIFNVKPPAVKLTSVELTGFDRQLHDPRGTIGYVGFKTKF